MCETDPIERAGDSSFGNAKHAGCEHEVFGCGQVLVETRRVREKPDMPAHVNSVPNEVMPVDPPFAHRRPQSRRDDSKQRALAAAIMSNDANDFSGLNLQGDRAQRPPRPESARQAIQFDGWLERSGQQDGLGRVRNDAKSESGN
jgi:hypothetical protein